MRINNRLSSGDTIVEVLLVIGIISLVLAGAFVATNRSLQTSRAAQERSEALKVAETQVEHIKYSQENAGKITFAPSGIFCIKDGTVSLKNNIVNIQSEPECLYGERYFVSVELAAGVYKVTVLWLSALPNSTANVNGTAYPNYDQLQLFYRS